MFSKNSRVFIDVSSKMTMAKQIGGVVISVVIFLAVRKWCEASRKKWLFHCAWLFRFYYESGYFPWLFFYRYSWYTNSHVKTKPRDARLFRVYLFNGFYCVLEKMPRETTHKSRHIFKK